MTKALELREIFSATTYRANYANAKAKSICIRCGKPAKLFRDASARLEYNVSALCQRCQDVCFTKRKPSD
ncbi:MAG: hypothetical protein JSV50_08595 [Desulfobacteraceae bacterium]|nr:MAG: hypothetical protein JSV50_08595 [Desulfobacteraceae bacterium]